ncbi:MAG: ZIP family metal transporter [Tissierella sp.]|uniref:ZIP family metal transporter n=1 Tax=Tissierella sp. TaxID=41274 RepID=UPI003F95C1CB
MNSILTITLYGFIVGMIGTGLGGVLSIFIGESKRFFSFLLGVTGGFMMFIITFHLLPESFVLGGQWITFISVMIGASFVIFIQYGLKFLNRSPLVISGLVLGLSIAVHNFPEGLALGSSFFSMREFGLTLSLAMLLHNIPEGLAIAIPLKSKGVNIFKIILFTMLTGFPTGIGTFLGASLGMLSNTLIAFCLSFAGGAMLYIIADEILPEGKKLYLGNLSSIGVVIGFLIGIFLYFK